MVVYYTQGSVSHRHVFEASGQMSTLYKFDPNTINRNENYETDLKYDLELNRVLLKMIGVWPADPRHLTNFDRNIAVLAKLLTTFLLLFFMIPIGCHLLFVEKDWAVRIHLLVSVTYGLEAMIKYALIIALNEQIKYCIDMIDSDWREVDWTVYRTIMLENSRSCRVFTTLFVTVNFTGLIIHHFIVPFVSDQSHTLGQNGTKHAPILYDNEFFIVDSRVSPMCEIVYLGQSLGAAATCGVNCGICTIIVKFAMHACSRYQMVIALTQSVNDVESNDYDDFECRNEKQRSFDHVIRRHLYATEIDLKRIVDVCVQGTFSPILLCMQAICVCVLWVGLRQFIAFRFVPRMENALNGMCFVCLTASTVSICCIGYTLIVEWEKSAAGNMVSYSLAAISLVSNIFVLCYCGEQLAEQCRQVGMAGYMTNWWNAQPHESRALILMIAMAQLPVDFTAGRLFNLSLRTFGAIIKMSFTYLNVLRSMIQYHE